MNESRFKPNSQTQLLLHLQGYKLKDAQSCTFKHKDTELQRIQIQQNLQLQLNSNSTHPKAPLRVFRNPSFKISLNQFSSDSKMNTRNYQTNSQILHT